jgi:uncharacterized protein
MMNTVNDHIDTRAEPAGFLGRNTYGIFFILACVLSFGAFLFGNAGEALGPIYEKIKLVPTTNLLQAIPILMYDPSAWLGIVQAVWHPLTPSISALIVCGLIGGWPAIRELLSRYRPWQSNVTPSKALYWYLVTIVVFVVAGLCMAGIKSLLAAPGTFSWAPGQIGWLPVAGWFVAGLFFDGGGVGEELGWRGFASAWLQKRHAPLYAAILLGLFWAAWHFPDVILTLIFEPKDVMWWLGYEVFFTIYCVATTIAILFFSNKLGGTAIIGVVVHSLMNDSFQLKGVIDYGESLPSLMHLYVTAIPYLIVAIVIVVISKGTLAFEARNPGRTVWTWPRRNTAVVNQATD